MYATWTALDSFEINLQILCVLNQHNLGSIPHYLNSARNPALWINVHIGFIISISVDCWYFYNLQKRCSGIFRTLQLPIFLTDSSASGGKCWVWHRPLSSASLRTYQMSEAPIPAKSNIHTWYTHRLHFEHPVCSHFWNYWLWLNN